LVRDHMRLTRGPRENRSRPAIDVLFRSAAVNNGTRVIGVLLSGYQNDGSADLIAIKERGGTAIVQDPSSAAAPDIPSSRLQATTVDHVASPAEIALLITDLAHRPAAPIESPAKTYDLELQVAGVTCSAPRACARSPTRHRSPVPTAAACSRKSE